MIGYGDLLEVVEGTKDVTILGYTYGIECDCHGDMKLGISDLEVMGTTLGDVDGFSGSIFKGGMVILLPGGIEYGIEELEESAHGDSLVSEG